MTMYYQVACKSVGHRAPLDPPAFAAGLADHLDELIQAEDKQIQEIATGRGRSMTRDEAVLDSMVWGVAFSHEARETAALAEWAGGAVAEFARWIAARIGLPVRREPIASWTQRARSVREEMNPHMALKKYREFMDSTAKARRRLEDARAQWAMRSAEEIAGMREERARRVGSAAGGANDRGA